MIPTPTLPYLAILPAVDNLAASHGEFSAIRLYIIFRNSRKLNAIFVSVFVSNNIVSHGTYVLNVSHLNKFVDLTHNSLKIVFS